MIIPDKKTGRYTIRGYPYWEASSFDTTRIIRIKAAKNIISLITQWKDESRYEGENTPGRDEMESYHKAIAILKQEREKYP